MRGATYVRLLVLALVATALPVVATAVPVDIGRPAAAMAATESSQQPNFVVVVTDDQRWDSIGRCSPSFDGSDYTSGASSCMPQVAQKLVANGVTFLRGEVSQSLCCPSRASILTGQYTRHHGVATLNGAAFDDSSSLATWLDSAGYRTGLVGKYLNGYGAGTLANYIPPGWDSFHAFHGYTDQDNPYTDYPWIDWDAGGPMVVTRHNNVDSTSSSACADGNLYSTDLICNQSMDFLASDSGTPFFLYVNPASPHSPQTIATRHQGIYAGLTISTYPSHNVIPSPNPPAYLRPTPLTTNQMNRYATSFRQALEQNRAVDDMVGVLYDQLAGDGRLANTVWVFVSDNGAATGEHRLTGKQCPYIECHRVPFIVVCPTGVCPGAANGTRDAVNYALNIDIAPTIADLAGVTPTLRVDGRSLVPILSNPGAPWRTEWALFESNVAIDGVVAKAADGAWYKYLVVVGTGEKQLYHLGNDPWELTNLWNNPSYSAVQTTMEGRLADALSDPGLTITVRPLANGPGTSATISFTSGEAVGFRCALDGGPETDCGTGTAGTVTYGDLTPGEHHVDVTAVDAYGNPSVTNTVTFTLTGGGGGGDTTPPTVSVSSPADGATVSGTVTVSATASDDVAVASVEVRVDGVTVTTDTSAPYTASWTTTDSVDGPHTITAVAVDTSGNNATSAEVDVTVDNPAPSGQFTASTYTVSTGQQVTFTDAHTGNHRRTIHFGDGKSKSSKAQTFLKTYNTAGTYVVTLDTKDIVTQANVTLSLTITVQ